MPDQRLLHTGYSSLHFLSCSISARSTSKALFLYSSALASDSSIVIVLSEVVYNGAGGGTFACSFDK